MEYNYPKFTPEMKKTHTDVYKRQSFRRKNNCESRS